MVVYSVVVSVLSNNARYYHDFLIDPYSNFLFEQREELIIYFY